VLASIGGKVSQLPYESPKRTIQKVVRAVEGSYLCASDSLVLESLPVGPQVPAEAVVGSGKISGPMIGITPRAENMRQKAAGDRFMLMLLISGETV
jgi:hypothetical protein